MSKFTIFGYVLDTEVIYIDWSGDVVSVNNHGAGSGELFVRPVGLGDWTLCRHEVNKYVEALNPIAVVDPTLKLERDIGLMYEIGKVYAFHDNEDTDPIDRYVGRLSWINYSDYDYPFVDNNDNAWRFVSEIDTEMLGKVKE